MSVHDRTRPSAHRRKRTALSAHRNRRRNSLYLKLGLESLEQRQLLSVLLSDSFNRSDAGATTLGAADLALGGIGNHYYSPLFATGGDPANPVGASIVSNALQNNGLDYGGVQFSTFADASTNPARVGEDLGQDLNIQVDILVPTDGAGHVSEAGVYLRGKAFARGANLLDGTSAGYWIALQSTGQVEVERLDTGALIAFSGTPVSFNNAIMHNLHVAAQGSSLQVALDGKLLAFSQNGLVSTSVSIPVTGGVNDGTVGIAFGDEPNPNQIGGQRVDNLVISTFSSLSGLPVQNNFVDRFEPNESFATAADLGVAPGVHVTSLGLQSTTDHDWYKFELLRPDEIDIHLGFVHSQGELVLEVQDAAQNPVGTVTSTPTGLTVSLADTLPAGTYYVHVSGAVNAYSLSVDPHAASTTRVFYVNDASTTNGYYTLAPGNDANDGALPTTPKASVQSVLANNILGPNDLVLIDTGSYGGATALIGAADEAAAYAGSPGGSNLSFGFDLTDADFNTIYGLRFTGGGTSIYAHATAIDQSTNNVFRGNIFAAGSTAIQVNGGAAYQILDNTISGNGSYGINFAAGGSATIQGNTISDRTYAIYGDGASTNNLELLIGGTVPNMLSAGTYGIYLGSYYVSAAEIVGNQIAHFGTGSLLRRQHDVHSRKPDPRQHDRYSGLRYLWVAAIGRSVSRTTSTITPPVFERVPDRMCSLTAYTTTKWGSMRPVRPTSTTT